MKIATMAPLAFLLCACGGRQELGPETPEEEQHVTSFEEAYGPAEQEPDEELTPLHGDDSGEMAEVLSGGSLEEEMGETSAGTFAPAETSTDPAGTMEVDAPDPEPPPFQGEIVSRKGKVVVIEGEGREPEVGASGSLLKYFEKQLGSFMTTGWLDVAGVKVKSVDVGKVTLAIFEFRSKIVVNGKKVDHFKKGNVVKLEFEE